VSTLRDINKVISTGADIVIVVLTDIAKHLVSISYAITVTPFLYKTVTKTFSFSSSATAFVFTQSKRLVLLVVTAYTTIVSYVHKVLPDVVDTLFVPTKKVAVSVVQFLSVLVRPKKTNVVASKQDDLYG